MIASLLERGASLLDCRDDSGVNVHGTRKQRWSNNQLVGHVTICLVGEVAGGIRRVASLLPCPLEKDLRGGRLFLSFSLSRQQNKGK